MSRPAVPYGANSPEAMAAERVDELSAEHARQAEILERRYQMVTVVTYLLVATKRAERLIRAFDVAREARDWGRTNAIHRAYRALVGEVRTGVGRKWDR